MAARTVQTAIQDAPTSSDAHWGDYEYSDTVYGTPGDIAAARLVYMNREGPNVRKVADLIDQRYGTLSSAVAAIGLRLDPDSAVGDQAEIVGELVGARRLGRIDSRLRRFAAGTGVALAEDSHTATQLGKVIGEWSGYADGEITTYMPPTVVAYGRIRAEDEPDLWSLLWTAIAAGTRLEIYGWDFPHRPLRGDYTDSSITNPGITDYTDSPITNASPTAYALEDPT